MSPINYLIVKGNLEWSSLFAVIPISFYGVYEFNEVVKELFLVTFSRSLLKKSINVLDSFKVSLLRYFTDEAMLNVFYCKEIFGPQIRSV